MSDVNVLVWHWEEIALILGVWAVIAAVVGSIFYAWRGRRAALWSLAVTVIGPPALVFGTLGLVIGLK